MLTATVAYHFSGPRLSGTPSRPCSVQLKVPLSGADDDSASIAVAFMERTVTVTFGLTQPTMNAGESAFYNDGFTMFVRRTGSPRPALTAIVDASGACTTLSTAVRFRRTFDQCTAKITSPWTSASKRWEGTLSVAYPVLDSVLNGDTRFALGFRRQVYRRAEKLYTTTCAAPGQVDPGANVCDPIVQSPFVAMTRVHSSLGPERYATAGADIGKPVDVPPHRTVTNAAFPLNLSTLASGAFADDAGKLLSLRDTAAKTIIDKAQAAKFTCRSCGSFQNDSPQPFTLGLPSTNALGIDLSTLGVDSVPFSFDVASYPVDAGYKIVHSGDALLAAAFLEGTTKSMGVARDMAVHYQNTFSWSASKLQTDVYHAVANRSQLAPVSPGPYAPIQPRIEHSADTLTSLGYSQTRAVTLDEGSQLAVSTVHTFDILLRYGTQYAGGSQTVDVAFSSLIDPAVLDLQSVYGTGLRTGVVLGYRNVGTTYAPIDAPFDLHTGQRGIYAVLDVTKPACNKLKHPCVLRTKPLDVKLTAFRFADSVQARDESAAISVTYPFFDTLSAQASYSVANLAVSQVGRANAIVVSDAQAGRHYLPNGQFSVGLTYVAKTGPTKFFQLSAGYTRADAQGCNPKLFAAPPPCYAFRSPSVTGALHWRPLRQFNDLFLDGSIQNSTNQPFRTGENAVFNPAAQDLFATTASHIVRSAGIGAHVFKSLSKGCSTVLLTTSNRGGDIDNFARNPPQPGFTNTASFELVPGGAWPTVLAAYSRIGNLDRTKPLQTMFVVRVQYGLLPASYASAVQSKCDA